MTDEDLSGPELDRRTTMKLLSAVGITGLAGCSSGNEETTTEEKGGDQGTSTGTTEETDNTSEKYGGKLNAAWNTGELNQLDPHLANLGYEIQVAGNIFSSLLTTTKDLKVKGDLATDWEVENAQHFTFKLREDAKFQDGYGKVTAEDFKHTYKRAMNLDGSLAKSAYEPLKDLGEGGVEVVDKYKVRLNFEEPFAPGLLSVGTRSVISKKATEDMSKSEFKTAPVGSGPFKVKTHELGQLLELRRFENYYETDEEGNQLPYLDGVDIQFIPEASTLVNGLKSGQVDFANDLPLQNVKSLKDANEVSVKETLAAGWTGVQINTLREPFKNPKVRLALAKTINNQGFIDAAFFGNAVQARGPVAPVHTEFYRDDKPSYQAYDPEKAKQMLEEAGALNASFSILTDKANLRQAKAMKNQLNENFNVDIKQVTTSTFWDLENKKYDIAVTGAAPDITVDGPLYEFFRPNPDDEETKKAGGTFNDMWYNDEEVTELLAKQRTTTDVEERKKIVHKVEDKIMKDAPVAFTHHSIPYQAIRENVKGYAPHIEQRDFSTVWLKN